MLHVKPYLGSRRILYWRFTLPMGLARFEGVVLNVLQISLILFQGGNFAFHHLDRGMQCVNRRVGKDTESSTEIFG